MPMNTKLWIGGIAVALLTVSPVAAKKKKVAPPPPPPPAPVVIPVVVIPPKPYPPMRAAPNLTIPPLGLNGVRQTVNAQLSPAQTTWNLRSAWNVAALNCQQPQHAGILIGYKAYLKTHAKALRAANLAVDAKYKKEVGIKGTAWIRAREAYMTRVYNYYASPPTLPAFCDAALAMSLASAAVPVGGLDAFSAAELPKIEAVFENFFKAYEQYRVDLALWEAKYAPPPPAPLILPTAVPALVPAAASPAVAAPAPPASAPAAATPIVSAAPSPAPSASPSVVEGR